MAGMDEVLERLVLDGAFRDALATDPDAALAGYDLTDEDRTTLAAHLDQGAGTSGRVEQRTSKSGLAGMLSAFAEPDVGAGPSGGQVSAEHPQQSAYGTVTMKDALVSSYQTGADPEVAPDDLAAAETPTEEAIQPTYPGVYIEEVSTPPPPSTTSPAESQYQESDLDFLSRHSEEAQPIDEYGRAKVVFPFDAADDAVAEGLTTAGAAETAAKVEVPNLKLTIGMADVETSEDVEAPDDLAAQPGGHTIREEMSLNDVKMELDEGGDGREDPAGASTGDAEEAGRPRTDDVTLKRGTTSASG